MTENQPPIEQNELTRFDAARSHTASDSEAGAGVPTGPAIDLALRTAVLELERHVAGDGWDQPARLFALVPTEQLLADEPQLAQLLGMEPGADVAGSLTSVEQDDVPADEPLEAVLTHLMWPDEVRGTAVALERLVLPPSAGDLPEDADEAERAAQSHPDRQEVRMVAGATRGGATYCALRLRSHDDNLQVIEGPDLVPALLELLQATLAPVEQ